MTSPLPSPATQQSVVVVVGDTTAANVLAELRRSGVSITDDKSLMESTSLVVIAQNATTGAMPVHQEIVKEIAHTSNPKLLWILTNSSAVDDPELLELEELEARELLNQNQLPGDTIQFALDAESASGDQKAPTLKGWAAIIRFVSMHGTRTDEEGVGRSNI